MIRRRLIGTVAALALASCGGGDGGGTVVATNPTPTPSTPTPTPAPVPALTSDDVGRIVAQAAGEARARGRPAVIAVTDRVGNVLAVFRMTGAPANATIPTPKTGVNLDAQGLVVPAAGAAIAKAITGAYLSSSGNAFSSRTASEIVQQHFPPAPSTAGLESGPLFGVQFSQLPCSDLAARYSAAGGAGALIGPKRSPLGLAADPGGLPLYKDGQVVGGVGVLSDGVYGFDTNTLDVDQDDDEAIAQAATTGFAAPASIRADRIYVDGTQLRFSDATVADLKADPASASFAAVNGTLGSLIAVRGYYGEGGMPALLAGQPYGSEASGVRPATAAEFAAAGAYVLSDGAGANRFPIRAATDGADVPQPLSAAEVRAVIEQAYATMRRSRAQIRQPLDSAAQVSISVVDTRGAVLGLVRSEDAPVFGIDVSLQKARTAAFFSGARAGSDLSADPSADVRGFVGAARSFMGSDALTGRHAFTDRANGLLSRPYFPDGQLGTANGPFSRPIDQFSPFSTGLQSALVVGNLGEHLAYVTGAAASDTAPRCTSLPDAGGGESRLANGIQIFPGSVPIYRGSMLVGGIGVSGDGIDQDDMIAFLGLYNAGLRVGGIGNAPSAIRSDQIVIQGVRLRYVSCPFAPFLDSSEQNVCAGL